MPEDLPLEPDLIKVLASDTRRDILRHIQDRRMTVTELARELDMGKATVHEHLKKLNESGLIQREEDERLWVYYDLTPRGKRILNPQRTRFYLVVGITVLAGIAAILAVALFLQGAGGPNPVADESGSAQDPLAVTLTDRALYEGENVQLDALVEASDTEDTDLRVFLVDEQAAERLRAGASDVQGIPLTLQASGSAGAMDASSPTEDASAAGADAESTMTAERTELSTQARLSSGTYYVYVRSPTGTDNRATMPSLTVRDIDVQAGHETWYQGLSSPLNLAVTGETGPLEGTLVLEPADPAKRSGNITAMELSDGQATVPTTRMDTLPAGDYTVRVLPAQEGRWLDLGSTLRIERPSFALTPRHTLEDRPIHLTAHMGVPLDDVGRTPKIAVEGANVTSVEPQGSSLVIEAMPAEPGTITVQVGRLAPRAVQVHAGLDASLVLHDGPELELTLNHLDGRPAAAFAVHLNGTPLGFTNETGQLRLPVPEDGRHVLAFRGPEGRTVEQAIEVSGWDVHSIQPRLDVRPTGEQVSPGLARLDIDVSNPGPTTVPTTVTSQVDGRTVEADELVLEGASAARVTVDVPVDEGGEHRFDVQAGALETARMTFENRTAPPSAGDATGGGAGGAGSDEGDGSDPAGSITESPPPDSDGDGIPDGEDPLPNTPGTLASLSLEMTGTPAAFAEFEDRDDLASPLMEPVTSPSAVDERGQAPSGDGQAPTAGPAPVLVLVALLAAMLVAARLRKRG